MIWYVMESGERTSLENLRGLEHGSTVLKQHLFHTPLKSQFKSVLFLLFYYSNQILVGGTNIRASIGYLH